MRRSRLELYGRVLLAVLALAVWSQRSNIVSIASDDIVVVRTGSAGSIGMGRRKGLSVSTAI